MVYKALYIDKQVAVKELRTEWEDKSVEVSKYEKFRREVQIMGTLDHENVVKLFGITFAPKLSMVMEFVPFSDLFSSFHVKDPNITEQRQQIEQQKKEHEKNLNEYMRQGKEDQETLTSLTFQRKKIEELERQLDQQQFELDNRELSMNLRYKVALDIARGMRYLHSFHPPIIHRDLRSPNIFVR